MPTGRLGAVALTMLAYILTTFGVQGTSHFALNADHYAHIPFMRGDPIVALGLGSMLVQGAIFGLLFPAFKRGAVSIWDGVKFSWILGGFLASYVVLSEAGKYAITGIPSWMAVEGSAAFVQYSVFGLLLGLIHRRPMPSDVTA